MSAPGPTSLPDLGPLLELRGVRQAAWVSEDGQLLAAAGQQNTDPGLIAAAMAVLRSLQAATDSPGWNDLLLDLDGGPLLLTPGGAGLLLVHFDEVPSLGRVRLGVRRVLAQVVGTQAVGIQAAET